MGLVSLDKLVLEKNNIQILTQGVFEGLGLYLSNNPLSVVPSGAFKGLGLVSLRSLYLMNANIKDIEDGAFAELNTLQELILDSNALTVVTLGCLKAWTCLKELYFTENRLTSTEPGTFGHLSKLTGLYLYSNQLVTLKLTIFLF